MKKLTPTKEAALYMAEALNGVQSLIKAKGKVHKLSATPNSDVSVGDVVSEETIASLKALKEAFDGFISTVHKVDMITMATKPGTAYGAGKLLRLDTPSKYNNLKTIGTIFANGYVTDKLAATIVDSAVAKFVDAVMDLVTTGDFSNRFADVEIDPGLSNDLREVFSKSTLLVLQTGSVLKGGLTRTKPSGEWYKQKIQAALEGLRKKLEADPNITEGVVLDIPMSTIIQSSLGGEVALYDESKLNATQRYTIKSLSTFDSAAAPVVSDILNSGITVANAVHGYKRNSADSQVLGLVMAVAWSLTGPSGLGAALAQGFAQPNPN